MTLLGLKRLFIKHENHLSLFFIPTEMSFDNLQNVNLGSANVRSRIILRSILSKSVDHKQISFTPDTWRFKENPFGKPFVIDEIDASDLNFSLSRSQNLEAMAILQGAEVGVDLEAREDSFDWTTIDIAFSLSEKNWLRDLPHKEQNQTALQLWTMKEAYLKMRGIGLSIDPSSFGFSLKEITRAFWGFFPVPRLQTRIHCGSIEWQGREYRFSLAVPLQAKQDFRLFTKMLRLPKWGHPPYQNGDTHHISHKMLGCSLRI